MVESKRVYLRSTLCAQYDVTMIFDRNKMIASCSLGKPPVSSVTWRHYSRMVETRIRRGWTQSARLYNLRATLLCTLWRRRRDVFTYLPHDIIACVSHSSDVNSFSFFFSFIIILSLVRTLYSEQTRSLVIRLHKLYTLFNHITITFFNLIYKY